MSTLYDVLGVERDATFDELKKGFKQRAIWYHPDKNPDNPHAEEQFKLLNQAYQILIDPVKRQQYDHLLAYEEQRRAQEQYHYASSTATSNVSSNQEEEMSWAKKMLFVFLFFAGVATLFLGFHFLTGFNEIEENNRAYDFSGEELSEIDSKIIYLINKDSSEILCRYLESFSGNYSSVSDYYKSKVGTYLYEEIQKELSLYDYVKAYNFYVFVFNNNLLSSLPLTEYSAQVEFAKILFKLKKESEAITFIRKYSYSLLEKYQSELLIADYYFEDHDFKKAFLYYESVSGFLHEYMREKYGNGYYMAYDAVSRPVSSYGFYCNKALTCVYLKNEKDAILLFQEAINSFPEKSSAYVLLAELQISNGQVNKGCELLNTAFLNSKETFTLSPLMLKNCQYD